MLQPHRNKMALMTRLKKGHEVNENDVTKNLFSLQFESALNDEEKKILYLRNRAHAITVYQCAESAYFVRILRKIRSIKDQLKNPNLRHTTKILQDDKNQYPFVVGIIGCGRLGNQIANCLLRFGRLNPSELQVSTRRPETLEHLKQRGVDCYYDNIRLVQSVHILFVCVLPSQLTSVAEELKHCLPPNILLYIPTCGIPSQRLRQMLGTSNILQPVYTWSTENSFKQWGYGISINQALESEEIVLKTCPISDSSADNTIAVNPKLAELFIFATVNMCTDMDLNREETLAAVHRCMFGDDEKQPLKEHLTLADFGGGKDGGNTMFPQFDLIQVSESQTHIMDKLLSSSELRRAYVKCYLQVFEDYMLTKAYDHSS